MGQLTILYIEDNPENQLLVRRILQAEGYTVVEAMDGPTGLDLARQTSPDLILLDINLPEMDGYELADLLRRYNINDYAASVKVFAVKAR